MAKAATKKAAPAKKAASAKSTARKSTPKVKDVRTSGSSGGALANYYRAQALVLDKKLDLLSGHSIFADPISTGSLVIDHVLSGGIYPIFNQISGAEGAGKTTLSLSTLGTAYNTGVPFIEVHDAEGTIAPEYAANMFKSFDISNIFEDGSVARYYNNDVLDVFTDKVSSILKVMPDKLWLPEAETWAYAVKKGSDRRAAAIVSALRNGGLTEDKALSKDQRWIFPTEYRSPEGLIMLDSWPALMTEKVDEEGQSNQMAGNATPLSKALPRFAGKLRRKGVALFSVNQIRENPGVRYGSPLYEPGGNTLKHATACRLRMHSRAVPQGMTKDPENGSLGMEESITGNGYDYYAYKAVENTKHKMGRPFLKGMIRIWVADETGAARGIDPFWDTWNYLKTTAQIQGTVAKFKFTFRPSIKSDALRSISDLAWNYPLLKELVIAEHFGYNDILRDLANRMGFKKKPNLRARLFEQIRTDKGLWATEEADFGEDYEAEEDDE